MDCVNHTAVNATAFCQNCGKALCADCVRTAAGGQILCEPCMTAWQGYQAPFVAAPPPGVPNPAVAAVLGIIPGVGAMYNGQFVKGLIHVVIFAALVSAAHVFGIFGLLIAAWIIYQSFEAYHTARARRDGDPLPDPLGLNEVGTWFTQGGRPHQPGQPPVPPPPANPGPGSQQQPPPYQSEYQPPSPPPYQQTYQGPYTPPAAGFTNPAAPPVPPVPPAPYCWGRKEPVGAVVLIALGVLFLLAQLDVLSGEVFKFMWPLLLIGLGVWLIVRRLGDSQGGSR